MKDPCTNNVATAPDAEPALLLKHVSHLIRGADVMDLRPGFDSAACFASFAKSLIAMNRPLNASRCVEMDAYVAAHAHKLHEHTPNFTCSNDEYFALVGKSVEAVSQTRLPDMDVYLWWQRMPFWSTAALLEILRRAAAKGDIRHTARALVLFDMTQWRDAISEQSLHANATWTSGHVLFDEVEECISRHDESAKSQVLCHGRANGSWIASMFALT